MSGVNLFKVQAVFSIWPNKIHRIFLKSNKAKISYFMIYIVGVVLFFSFSKLIQSVYVEKKQIQN